MNKKKLKEELLFFLKEVQNIQKSKDSKKEKIKKISKLWKSLPKKIKVSFYALLGLIGGLATFGTGGIGIALLGTAIPVSPLLVTSIGTVLVGMAIEYLTSKNME